MSKYSDLMDALETNGMIEFGRVIPGKFIREVLGIEYPEIAPKKVYDELALAELGATDYIRSALLNRGMYLAQYRGDYRILLPSENARQVECYMSSADKKLSRALKLTRNTPRTDLTMPDQTEARIIMKKLGVKQQFM